jgi:hypothetical protein
MVDNTSLAFSSSGQPYVAYWGNPDLTVMKFNGTNWVNVGTPGFSSGYVDFISLAFNSVDSLPYLAYQDFGYSQKATVMKYNGTNWVDVGSAGFSAGEADNTSLAFSPSGNPYVAYMDDGNSGKATVMEYAAPTGIKELQSQISIYPNPATTEVIIETSAIQTQSQLSIMNLSGEEIISYKITQPKTKIDVATLPNGVYFVRLTNDRTVGIGKFIKK